MKKLAVLVVLLALAMGTFAGCSKDEVDVIDIYVPDGAPALAVVGLFDKEEIGGEKVKFTVVPPSTINEYLLRNEADIAVLPTNAASIIFNRGEPYKYIAACTYGNLFMVGFEDVTELSELEGKVVGVIGQGQVPDLIFKSLLNRNGIEFEASDTAIEGKVALRYADDGSILMPLIKNGNVDFGVLAEPAVATALSNIAGLNICFDIQELWGGGYPQAGIMAKSDVSDKFISAFLAAAQDSERYAYDNTDAALERIAANMRESTQTTIKSLNKDIVLRCNIGIRYAEDCKDDVIDMLTEFHKLNPASVGGSVPTEMFREVR